MCILNIQIKTHAILFLQFLKTLKKSNRKNTYNYKNVQTFKNTKVSTATTRVKFNFTLDLSVPKIAVNQAHNLGYTGKDIYVAVIDSGIEAAHPFFQNRVALEACFADTCPNGQSSMIGPGAARPVHWHGTHVAGIIAGKNSSFTGVAPDAKIIAINVFDPLNGAYDENIIEALNWVASLSSQYNIASVNMSLGGSAIFKSTCDDYIPQMTQAIKNLKDKNPLMMDSSRQVAAKILMMPVTTKTAYTTTRAQSIPFVISVD